MKSKFATFALAVGLLCPAAFAKDPPWEEAAKTYESAMSQYNARLWDQAEVVLENFVKKYRTNEEVPVAYLRLAYCRYVQKHYEEYNEALDQVIKRFGGSPAWFRAYASKLAHAKELKNNTEYFALLAAMASKLPELPMELNSDIRYWRCNYWRHEYGGRAFGPIAARMGVILQQRSYIIDAAHLADSPQLAQKALGILAKTLRLRQKDMPGDWQAVHVILLRKADKGEQADKALAEYVKAWGDDPRGMELYLALGDHAEKDNDLKAAAAAYEHLVKNYAGCSSLEKPLFYRLNLLYKKDRYEEFTQLASVFLKSYPGSRWYYSVINYWAGMANREAQKGQTSRIPAAMKMLEENGHENDRYYQKQKRIYMLGFNATLKNFEAAAKIAAELLSEKNWCRHSYNHVRKYSSQHESIAKVLQDSLKRNNMLQDKPNAEAAKLLKDLRIRIRDQQDLWVEEIGEKMFSRHRNDAATLQAVSMIADYYFKKVMPEQRDKWMARMISTYPRHILTEQVLNKQITAEKASRRYDRLAAAIEI
ncbi:MAG: tetratricopeptide repeat protein, partial [Phycisphaerae bacterium]|nr:tetratricopeptide repeat protein [Phycisphaerae bacterium]